MSQHGATLQTYNNELVKCIEDLYIKRDSLNKLIAEEELQKYKLETELKVLTEKLAKINESVSKKIVVRSEFDEVIGEAEDAYTKILESSQTLLTVVKKESHCLAEKIRTSPINSNNCHSGYQK